MTSHWDYQAAQWHLIAPPLRPCSDDIVNYEAIISNIAAERSTNLLGILLGVTPEITCMNWPAHTRLIAVEQSEAMIQHHWHSRDSFQCVQGNWFDLPSADNQLDFIIGDGCFTTLDSSNKYTLLLTEIHRALKPGGLFVQRFFINRPIAESLAEVKGFPDANFQIFKWRIAMSLQLSIQQGVALKDIWQAIETFKQEHPLYASCFPTWTKEIVSTTEVYRNSSACYTFPTLIEITDMADRLFTRVSIKIGSYPFAERCPILVYRK